jgi:hypothetical protein
MKEVCKIFIYPTVLNFHETIPLKCKNVALFSLYKLSTVMKSYSKLETRLVDPDLFNLDTDPDPTFFLNPEPQNF